MYEYLVIDNSGNKYLNKFCFLVFSLSSPYAMNFPHVFFESTVDIFYVCEKYTIFKFGFFFVKAILSQISF